MVTPDEAQELAEKAIQQYVTDCGCTENLSFQNIMEKWFSTSVRAVEKYNGHGAALALLSRTAENLIANPQNKIGVGKNLSLVVDNESDKH